MKKKLIVGNWKMNGSLAANAVLLKALKQGLPEGGNAGVAFVGSGQGAPCHPQHVCSGRCI